MVFMLYQFLNKMFWMFINVKIIAVSFRNNTVFNNGYKWKCFLTWSADANDVRQLLSLPFKKESDI